MSRPWEDVFYVNAKFKAVVLAWLDNNCRHTYYTAVPPSALSGIATFALKEEIDAVAFKLRFGI